MARMSRGNLSKIFLTVAGFLASLPTARGQMVYDAVAQFDTVNNPSLSTPWTYGYLSASPTDSLLLLESAGSGTDASDNIAYGWSHPAIGGVPGIVANLSPTNTYDDGPTIIDPREINLHPGPSNEFAILRFTAPFTALYSFNGDFNGNSRAGTTTDVHILKNTASLFSDTVAGYGTITPFLFLNVSLNAGETLNFIVGSNGGNFNDSTGLHLQITAIPEPATGSLLVLGLAGLLALGRRHRTGRTE